MLLSECDNQPTNQTTKKNTQYSNDQVITIQGLNLRWGYTYWHKKAVIEHYYIFVINQGRLSFVVEHVSTAYLLCP